MYRFLLIFIANFLITPISPIRRPTDRQRRAAPMGTSWDRWAPLSKGPRSQWAQGSKGPGSLRRYLRWRSHGRPAQDPILHVLYFTIIFI